MDFGLRTRKFLVGVFLVLLTLSLLSIVSCQAPTTPPTPPTPPATTAPSSAEVEISGFAFKPDTVTVAAGGTVTWTNRDSASHNIVSDSGLFKSDSFGLNGTFSYTFKEKGTFTYHCGIHSSMKGTVIVE